MNGGDFSERTVALKKSLRSNSERIMSKIREPTFVRSETEQVSERKGGVEAMVYSQEESELLDAKNTVKDLRLRIEQSNSRAKAPFELMEKLKRSRKVNGDWGMSAINDQSLEVMKELEDVKQELSKLKLDMASLLEEKKRAEKETEASKMKERSCARSADTLRNEIDEINEEHVLVELARIEAVKERATVQSMRKQDSEKHFAEIEGWRKRIDVMTQETDRAKDLETKLANTLADVNMLESELNQAKEMDKIIQGKENDRCIESDTQGEEEPNAPDILNSITKEIEMTRKELGSVKEESFRFMASMDIIRTEIRNVSDEAARVRRREEKTESLIQNLNVKLLRGRAKLEAATSAEEKAKSIVASLSRNLEQYKTEAEAAKKEGSLIKEETQKIKEEIDKTESDIDASEEKLQVAIEELKSIKLSEATALENLKTLIENKMRNRESDSGNSSVITISKFEYEYLKSRAAGAEEIADKRVAAAQAWIEALKASEREILMKTEKARKENRDQKSEKKSDTKKTEQPLQEKGLDENDFKLWMQNYDMNMAPGKMQHASLSGRSSNKSGKLAPARRGKHPVSVSPGIRGKPRAASFAVRRRAKEMPNLAKFFSGRIEDMNA